MKYLNFFKKMFNPKASTLGNAYLKCIFFWNPIFSMLICLWMNGFENFFSHFRGSYLITVVVSTACFAAVIIVHNIETQFARHKGLQQPNRNREWYYLVSLCAMPLGLYIAFQFVRSLGYSAPNAEDYRAGLIIGTLIAGFFFLLQSRANFREATRLAELKLKNLENERLQAQISALTAQMNPHFLFNALNTVASLIQTDPEKAEETIVKLSELYRGVLNSSRKMTHSLAAEIDICKAYLTIEKARFGDRLTSVIAIDPGLDSLGVHLPALSIQPLVENAVKHGLASRASGGEIYIKATIEDEKLKIYIEDNGIGFKESALIKKQGTGIGIKSCQERLRLHYGDSGKFVVSERVGGGTIVFLEMPLNIKRGNS